MTQACAVLLSTLGSQGAMIAMAAVLVLVWLASLRLLKQDLGKMKAKPRFTDILSKSRTINVLSAARMFLFGSRDVWFVVALPVFMSQTFAWDHWLIGSFMACWINGYGLVQSLAPRWLTSREGQVHGRRQALVWSAPLAVIPALIALSLIWTPSEAIALQQVWMVGGLALFGVLFAINSSLHGFLLVDYAKEDGVSLDVGFYYMANAMGGLVGTLLSGWLFQVSGLAICLVVSSVFMLLTFAISFYLPKHWAPSRRGG